MKRIYYITNMFPGKHDNYGIFCKKTFDFFNNSKDFSITIFSGIKGKSFNKLWNIIRYIVLLFSISINMIFKIKKFDIIYIQYVWKHAFFVSYFLKNLEKKNKRLFINFHGEDLTNYDLLNKIEKKQFKKLCIFSSGIVVPSLYFKNLLSSLFDINLNDKIIISPSGGVNSNVFFKQNTNRDKTIIYCSRFDSNKGWDDFIMAAHDIISDRDDLSFIMIGYGKETNDVKKMIFQNNLQNSIKVVINPIQTHIADIYSKASLFVFPTRRQAESLGLVALEAMSCGLPVVASNIGAIGEYIKDNENGYLYTTGDVKELTSKIIKFFEKDNDEMIHMQKNAIDMAEIYKDKNVETDFIRKVLALI